MLRPITPSASRATRVGWFAALVVLAACLATLPSASAARAQSTGQGCLPIGADGLPLQGAAAPVAGAPASPTAAVGAASPAPAASPLPTRATVTDTAGRTAQVVRVHTGAEPYGIAVDSSDQWARTWAADRGSGRVTALFGRSEDLRVACQLPVGPRPHGVAVDGSSGRVLVTLRGEPRVVVIEGRTDQPAVIGSVELPRTPGWVAIDQETRRAFVSLPEAGQVAILEPSGGPEPYRLAGTFESGAFPGWLAVDQATGRLVVSNEGQPPTAGADQGAGSVAVFDGRAARPVLLYEPIEASVPTGIAFDPRSGNAYVLENGADNLVTIAFPSGEGAPTVTRLIVDPYVDEGRNTNPVDLVLLPGSRELVVTTFGRVRSAIGGHLDVIRLSDDGSATWDRAVPAAQHTTGIALDPVTGRVFVSEVDEGSVAAYTLDEPTAPPPPPATVVETMPGPLEVSFAPADVARTVGISLLVLLLLGAPTPLFNETLEANLGDIQAALARRLPKGAPGRLARIGGAMRRLAASRLGLVVYLLAAALIFSFLSPGFPSQNGLIVFGVAVLGLTLATTADILPGQRYVVRRYGDHGRVRVAIWTLGLAAICVLISRLSGMQPGFMYGVIGTFAFAAALGVGDEGRMEARGAVALLALAIVAWFARVPFEPAPGVPASGATLVINAGLVGVFVVAVEGLVFGLVPLSFMPGQKIWAWSRWRWLLLWGAGLALFVHVLVYPVTVAQPNPDPASLTTTLLSVALYGAVAIGFWAWFRWRAGHGGSSSAQEAVPAGGSNQPAAEE